MSLSLQCANWYECTSMKQMYGTRQYVYARCTRVTTISVN